MNQLSVTHNDRTRHLHTPVVPLNFSICWWTFSRPGTAWGASSGVGKWSPCIWFAVGAGVSYLVLQSLLLCVLEFPLLVFIDWRLLQVAGFFLLDLARNFNKNIYWKKSELWSSKLFEKIYRNTSLGYFRANCCFKGGFEYEFL